MPVRKRLQIKGTAIAFVTTTAFDWTPIFSNKQFARIVLNQFNYISNQFNVSIIAYVLMPSHLHALLGFKDISLLSSYMKSFKSTSSRLIKSEGIGKFKNRLYKDGKFHLWKPRFDDLIISSEEQFRIKMSYIHNNPIKADLIARSEDFEYSSAIDWLTNKRGYLEIDKEFKFL